MTRSIKQSCTRGFRAIMPADPSSRMAITNGNGFTLGDGEKAMRIQWLTALVLLSASVWTSADEVRLNPSHPVRYEVVPGDTLWDIAGRFLAKPWEWPSVWQRNPQVANPDLIYPGDILELAEVGGRTRIRLAEPSEIRLSPRIRIDPTPPAIPTIRMAAIRPFLTTPRVLTEDEKTSSPDIIGLADGRILGGEGDLVYVRSLLTRMPDSFTVVRPGQPYKDADTAELLGYEGLYVADAQLLSPGDPATVQLLRGEREAWIGDRVLPMRPEATGLYVHPHVTARPVRGHIISVLEGVYDIGQYHVVAIDRGSSNGIEVGHVFDIVQKGSEIREVYSQFGAKVFSPEQQAGSLMVFRVFHRVSFGLVLHATRALHVLDIIQTP